MLVKVNVRLAHDVLPGAVIDVDPGPRLDGWLGAGWVTDVSTVEARLRADGYEPPEPEPEVEPTVIEVPEGARLVDVEGAA